MADRSGLGDGNGDECNLFRILFTRSNSNQKKLET